MKPKFANRLKIATQVLTGRTTKNSDARVLAAREFLKYGGNRNKIAMPNWSQVIMSDEDAYTGLMYGAIDVRAVTVASIGINNISTEGSSALMDQARSKREELIHPYLDIIDKSKSFSNYEFWYKTSTYLDLEGLMYILAIRNVSDSGSLIGQVQEFKLLNPYNVQRIFDTKTGDLLGYKEYRGSTSREIPKEMIIPIIKLNPFSEEPFSMADAARDHQFTLKTASDYTRSAIAGNINAPGIIATDAVLEGEELANFKARITSHERGEPLFGGGAGSITWNDMQQDLNKAALTDVNTISLQNIIAASGASKTMLGWEESGTTRNTSGTQKDNFIELRAMPQTQLIIDALNQDYKNYYPTKYESTELKIYIENPLGSDMDEEGKMIDNRTKNLDLYDSLIGKGYDRELAARYADGDITLEELGEPSNEPTVVEDSSVGASNSVENHYEEKEVHTHRAESGLLNQTQASLQNTITNLDNRLLGAVVNKIGEVKNDFNSEDDIVNKRDRNQIQNELEISLAAFYGVILPLYAYNVLSDRLSEYGKATQFKMNNDVKSFIKEIASKASESHVTTLLESMVKQAQADALKGLGRDQIARNLLNRFGGEIAKSRAITIARTETNRAFTMSQYQADKQFLKQHHLQGKAYKVWHTRSIDPCQFCQDMANRGPIPFHQPFATVGDELSAKFDVDGKTKVKKMTVGFMSAHAGNLHPNCSCDYDLIIR